MAERLKLTGNETLANAQLVKARESTDSGWPDVGFLAPLHPFGDWLVDKVLATVGVATRRRSSSQKWTVPCSACRACTPTGVVTRSLWSGWPSPSTSARR
ncbi:MAG: hypothetical protein IPF42_16945 [Candidatus Microthrix sp.]|nr:hypothetical protein [Candidatus Microthrix sp.]